MSIGEKLISFVALFFFGFILGGLSPCIFGFLIFYIFKGIGKKFKFESFDNLVNVILTVVFSVSFICGIPLFFWGIVEKIYVNGAFNYDNLIHNVQFYFYMLEFGLTNFIDLFLGRYWDYYLSDYLPFGMLLTGISLSGFSLLIFSISDTGNRKNISDIKKSEYKKSGSKVTKEYAVMDSKKFKKIDILKEHIGISYTDYSFISVTQNMLNKMMLFIGSTGSGKTESLKNLFYRWINKKQFTIVIDAKPDVTNITKLQELADKQGVPFYGFNCANNLSYDFLNNGSPTMVKDKLMGLKNNTDWSSDYYKTQAETYLQTAIEVLQKIKDKITLDDVIDSFNFEGLSSLLPNDLDVKLKKRLNRIKDIDTKDLVGLKNQLILINHSDFGDFLATGNDNEFNLDDARKTGGFVYFALPSLKYPSFAKVVGKLVVNDIKTILEKGKPINCVFDEFSVFAGEQVLNLINQGRGLDLYCAFGTQSTSDLSAVDSGFKNQFLANMNTLLVQLINDKETADDVIAWAGNMQTKEYTASINEAGVNTGNVRLVDKEILQHSDLTRQPQGDGYIMTKVDKFFIDKIRVNYLG